MIRLSPLVLCCIGLAPAYSYGQEPRGPIRICYASPPVAHLLPRALDKPWHHVGFRAAIDEYNASHEARAELVEVTSADGALGSCPHLVSSALNEGCHVLVGLVRSSDALQMGPALQAAQMTGFSSTAAHRLPLELGRAISLRGSPAQDLLAF